MATTRVRLLLCLSAAGLVLAGCGASSSSSSSRATAPSSSTTAVASSTSTPAGATTTSAASPSAQTTSQAKAKPPAGSGARQAPATQITPETLLRARPHDSFETALNQLCARGNAAAARYAAGYRAAFAARNYAKLADLRDSAIRAFQGVAGSASLTPPAADRSTYQQYLTASQDFASAGFKLDGDLRSRNLTATRNDEYPLVLASQARAKAAVALGARACAI